MSLICGILKKKKTQYKAKKTSSQLQRTDWWFPEVEGQRVGEIGEEGQKV